MSHHWVTLRHRIADRLGTLADRIEPDYAPLTPEQTTALLREHNRILTPVMQHSAPTGPKFTWEGEGSIRS